MHYFVLLACCRLQLHRPDFRSPSRSRRAVLLSLGILQVREDELQRRRQDLTRLLALRWQLEGHHVMRGVLCIVGVHIECHHAAHGRVYA